MTNCRHSHWMTSGVFSTIALIALLKDFDKVEDQDKQVKWSVSGISIALAMAGLAVIANMLLRNKFVGTFIEGGMALTTFAMWAAVLPAIMEPGAMIATRDFGEVHNANLYFFSWGAFIMSFLVFVGFLKEKMCSGEEVKVTDFKLSSWAALTMTSFVTMVAASRLFKDAECDEDDNALLTMMGKNHDKFCDRTSFGVALGLVSGLISLLWIPIGGRFLKSELVHFTVTWLLLTAWVFGVAFLTFGADTKRPAGTLGNLYFFTWGSFGIIASLAASSLFKMLGLFLDTEEETNEEPADVKQKDLGGEAEEQAQMEEVQV